jgi:hypothetical protein
MAKRRTDEEEAILARAEAAARAHIATEGGRSIIDQLWDEMDAVVGRLLGEWSDMGLPSRPQLKDLDRWRDWGEERGQAQGLAFAIACMTQSYGDRDLDSVRAEAMARQERAEEED